jgi:hypothetical protein
VHGFESEPAVLRKMLAPGDGVEHADVVTPTVAFVDRFPAASYASTPSV